MIDGRIVKDEQKLLRFSKEKREKIPREGFNGLIYFTQTSIFRLSKLRQGTQNDRYSDLNKKLCTD